LSNALNDLKDNMNSVGGFSMSGIAGGIANQMVGGFLPPPKANTSS